MRRCLVFLVVFPWMVAACASGSSVTHDAGVKSPASLRSALVDYGGRDLRDVVAEPDGTAWLISNGPAVHIDADGQQLAVTDATSSGDPGMGGVLAAVAAPQGLFGLLGGCDCEDGRSIAGWLVRFDSATGALKVRRLLQHDSPYAIDYGQAGLWSLGGGLLRHIDPDTLDDVVVVPVASTAASLVVGDDAVYVGDASTGAVVRVDAISGAVTATFDGDPVIGAKSVAVGDALWTVQKGGVAMLDPDSLEMLARVEIAGARGGELDVDAGVLWLYTEQGLYEINAKTRTITSRLQLTTRHIGSLDSSGNITWITDDIAHRLFRVTS